MKTAKPAPKRKKGFYWLKEGLVLILLLTAFSFAVDYWRSQDMPSGKARALIAQTIQGESIDLIALSQNKPVMIYFWATWCPACQFVSPTIDWMSGKFEVLSVATSSGDTRRLNGYMKQQGYSFRVINDQNGHISRQWGIRATPSIVIISNGEIKTITTGISTPPGLWLRMFFT